MKISRKFWHEVYTRRPELEHELASDGTLWLAEEEEHEVTCAKALQGIGFTREEAIQNLLLFRKKVNDYYANLQ